MTSADNFDQVIATACCALSQGPLLVDEGTQTFESVGALSTGYRFSPRPR